MDVTVESIKLYNEFEQKAKENIIGKIYVSDNVLNGVAIVFNDNSQTATQFTVTILYKFKINDKEISVKEDIAYEKLPTYNSVEIRQFLGNKLKTQIAKYLAENVFKQIFAQLKEL